jgi:hypothetical protein
MSTGSTLKLHKDYLHVKLPQDYEVTPEAVQRQWEEIFDVCRKNNYRHVLIEGKISKRSLKTIDAYELAANLAHSGLILQLAFCFYDYTPDDISQFFVNVAQNRGAKVKFFSNKSDALRWLGVHSKKVN